MPPTPSIRVVHFALAVVLALGLSSCVVYDRPYGPGYVRHAPPPASMVYYDYWYYPDAQVYFDTNRRVYFYLSNQRWVETKVLPPSWRSRLHGYVPIHSRNARPYIEYREHTRKYPPRYREEHREQERTTPRYRNDRYPQNYHETPRKEPPPRTWQQLLEQNQHNDRAQPHSGSSVKSPVRERYHETPRKQPVKSVKQKALEKARAKEQRNAQHKNDKNKDKNKRSRRSKDDSQQDDQDRDRRDYR